MLSFNVNLNVNLNFKIKDLWLTFKLIKPPYMSGLECCTEWRSEDNFRSPFSPSTMGPGDGTEDIRFDASHLYHQTILVV